MNKNQSFLFSNKLLLDFIINFFSKKFVLGFSYYRNKIFLNKYQAIHYNFGV